MAVTVGQGAASLGADTGSTGGRSTGGSPDSLSGVERTAAAVVGALPGLVHAAFGGALLVDDYGFLRRSPSVWMNSEDRFSRPIQWATHLVQFELLGARPWAHALVMAVAGAVVALLLASAVNANLGRRAAVPVAMLWALYPATSTIRYWYSTVPLLIALGCLAGAWWCSAGRSGPSWRITLLVAASILSYESGLLLGLVVFALPLWRRRSFDLDVVPHAAAVGAALALNRSTSPKGAAAFDPLGSLGDLPTALFGPSLAPGFAGPLWVVALAVPLVAVVLRITRGPSSQDEALGVGALAIGLGMAVMATISFPLVPVGLLDRGNAMAGPGVAILLVAAALSIGERFGPVAARAVLGVLAVSFGLSTLEIGAAVRSTEDDLVAAVAAADDLDGVVAIRLPVRSGYAAVTQTWSLVPAAAVLGSDTEVVSTLDSDPTAADWSVVVGADGVAVVERPGAAD